MESNQTSNMSRPSGQFRITNRFFGKMFKLVAERKAGSGIAGVSEEGFKFGFSW